MQNSTASLSGYAGVPACLPLRRMTIALSDRFAERLICQHPLRILPHLCKGVARSKEFFLFLFADAHEIHGIFAEDTISETISV